MDYKTCTCHVLNILTGLIQVLNREKHFVKMCTSATYFSWNCIILIVSQGQAYLYSAVVVDFENSNTKQWKGRECRP